MTALRNYVTIIISLPFLTGCAPRVATSFWRIGTPADSARDGYTVIHAEGKTRHCYPITEWTSTDEKEDVYHQLHHHGVAVENELMAYRIYFDKKQTIDPYCKRTPQLELAQSYWYPNDSLLAAGYGDDILRVSGTVGVGSVKYWDGKLRHIENVAQRSQRILKQQKDQATIEVADYGWIVEGKQENISVQYTLMAGDRHMRCDVYTTDPLEGLCTGVQTIPAKGGWPTDTIILSDGTIGLGKDSQLSILNCQLENGVLLASWGTDWPVNDSAKYAKETVGIAVFIPKEFAGALVHDKSNNLCLLKQEKKRYFLDRKKFFYSHYTAHFYLTCCGATKEDHPVARNATEWYNYLRRWAKKLK